MKSLHAAHLEEHVPRIEDKEACARGERIIEAA